MEDVDECALEVGDVVDEVELDNVDDGLNIDEAGDEVELDDELEVDHVVGDGEG